MTVYHFGGILFFVYKDYIIAERKAGLKIATIEKPTEALISSVSGNSVTFVLADKSDTSYGKYLKLLKSNKVIAVGGISTGEVDLTGLGQRKHVNYKDYYLSYDTDNKMVLSKNALTPIAVNEFYTLGTPEAPEITLTPIEAGVKYSFTKPKDWGRPITGYEFRYAIDGTGDWKTIALSSNTTSGTLSNLTEDAKYWMQVRAKNEIGWGDMRSATSVYPIPTAPTGLKATPTETGAKISATKKSDIYRLDIYKTTDLNHAVASGTTEAEITKLESDLTVRSGNYKAYWYNTKGGSWSSASDVPGFTTLLHKPGFPVLTLTPRATSVSYRLTLPSDDGASGNGKQDILSYTIYYHKTGEAWQQFKTNDIGSKLISAGSVSGLEPDTDYEFRASATNSRYTGDSSPAVPTTTLLDTPDAPKLAVVYEEPTTTTIPLHITPGASDGAPNNGKADVTYFAQTQVNGGSWGTWRKLGTSTTPILTNLNAGTKYAIRVQARNRDANSSASNTVTVYTRIPQIKASEPDYWLIQDGNLISDTKFLNDKSSVTWQHGKRIADGYAKGSDAWEFTSPNQWSLARSNQTHSRFRANLKKGDTVNWRYKARVISGGSSKQSFEFLPEAYDTPTGARTEYSPSYIEKPNLTKQTGWTTITGTYTFTGDHNYFALIGLSTNNAPKVKVQFAEVELYLNRALPASYSENSSGYNHSQQSGTFENPAQERITMNVANDLALSQTGTGQVSLVRDTHNDKTDKVYIAKGLKDGEVDLTIADKNYPENKTVVHFYVNSKLTQPLSKDNIKVTGVTLNKTSASLEVGESVQLIDEISPVNASNKAVTWSSSDSAVAKVDNDGTVTAVKVGSATITVKTTDQAKTATAKITVTPKTIKVEGVSVDPTSLSLKVKGTAQLKASVAPGTATNKAVKWSSADTKVATVDTNGKVIGVKAGNTTITVTTVDGSKTANAKVTVTGDTGQDSNKLLVSITVNGKNATFNFSFKKWAGDIGQYNLNIFGQDTGYTKNFSTDDIADDSTASITVEGLAKGTYSAFFSVLSFDAEDSLDGDDSIFKIS